MSEDDKIAALESVRRANPDKLGWADLKGPVSAATARLLEREGLLTLKASEGLKAQITPAGAKLLATGGMRP